MIGFDLKETISSGEIARLATQMRQMGQIKPIMGRSVDERLSALGVALNLDPRITLNHIAKMEEYNWLQIHKSKQSIRRVDEYIPPLNECLKTIGKDWEDKSSKIDYTTVYGINSLSSRPYTKDALISELDIDEKTFLRSYDYGNQGNYLGTFRSTEYDIDLIWSPLYWLSNSESTKKFLAKQSFDDFDRLKELSSIVTQYPGKPFEKIRPDERVLLENGIRSGYFPSVAIKDDEGNHRKFVFGADSHFEIEPTKDIFEKARIVIACIRHGQHHAKYSRIRYPKSILKAIRTDSLGDHPYANVQYALLILNRICSTEETTSKFGTKSYKIHFISTPENRTAMDIAKIMLVKGVDENITSIPEAQINNVLTNGIFSTSSEERRDQIKTKIVAKDEYMRLMELVQGGIL